MITKPLLVKEFAWIDKVMYCRFHKSHNHNTNEYVHFKDTIDDLIKKGILTQYTQECGWKEDHKRNKESKKLFPRVEKGSPKKSIEVVGKTKENKDMNT